jgi:hypothetical protein
MKISPPSSIARRSSAAGSVSPAKSWTLATMAPSDANAIDARWIRGLFT